MLCQVQLREVTLQEENGAYEKSISNCQNKIQKKLEEADLLRSKLKVRARFQSLYIQDTAKYISYCEISIFFTLYDYVTSWKLKSHLNQIILDV